MTKEEIIAMAEGANIVITGEAIFKLCQLVAEHEREVCAVVAEECVCGCGRSSCIDGDLRAHDIAESIRSRGDKND